MRVALRDFIVFGLERRKEMDVVGLWMLLLHGLRSWLWLGLHSGGTLVRRTCIAPKGRVDVEAIACFDTSKSFDDRVWLGSGFVGIGSDLDQNWSW